MGYIYFDNKKFELVDYDLEEELEKDVVKNSKILFGQKTVYLDIKKRIGEKDSYHKTIPDGFLIDFTNIKNPQLYFVENELSSHDAYGHIAEQLLRFRTVTMNSQEQIKSKLRDAIEKDERLKNEILGFLKNSIYSTIYELISEISTKTIRLVLVINEVNSDLNHSLDGLRERPDVVELKRYSDGNSTMLFYEPMREEVSELEDNHSGTLDFDTIVCPALEEGFKHAFIENNAWWAIRLSQKAREQLKYLAIYEKKPIAAVRNYATIEKIEPYKDSGKFKVFLKDKKKVSDIVLDKDKKGIAPQGPRFTTLAKLKSAHKLSELWK